MALPSSGSANMMNVAGVQTGQTYGKPTTGGLTAEQQAVGRSESTPMTANTNRQSSAYGQRGLISKAIQLPNIEQNAPSANITLTR
jgi:hypothetical protein